MQTEFSPTLFEIEPVERHKVVAGFDGGIITSDAGGLLLGQLDRGLGLIRRMAACFHRPPGSEAARAQADTRPVSWRVPSRSSKQMIER